MQTMMQLITSFEAAKPFTNSLDLPSVVSELSTHIAALRSAPINPDLAELIEWFGSSMNPVQHGHLFNVYRLVPNEYGVVLHPTQIANGLAPHQVAEYYLSVFNTTNPWELDSSTVQTPAIGESETPALTEEEKILREIEKDLNFDISDALKEEPEQPINYSNIINVKGKKVDVSKLDNADLVYLIYELDDLSELENTEHIRSMYHQSVPTTKLYYPEPFIASPSQIHNDLGFLHILQYQFWLWFVFIFLIVFFFISFLCVVRWCNTRTRPRRETRGVSRSKCGDLITATVPVSWAASIIVSESTDATDYYDGFGTSEIIVGIRAYQWGWEYYYPKSIDLHHNVKPSYSSFVGNSLKYHTTSGTNLTRNNFWRTYQNKSYDAVVTPAHLLTLPLDNDKLLNFMNFKDVGLNPNQPSQSFKKIRSHSKIYTSNLSYIPTNLTSKYINMNNLYLNDLNFVESFAYGTRRQHNLSANAALTSNYSSFLDLNSRTKFLDYTLGFNEANFNNSLKNNFTDVLLKSDVLNNDIKGAQTSKVLDNVLGNVSDRNWRALLTYPSLLNSLNDDSDKKMFSYPHLKAVNSTLSGSKDLVQVERTMPFSTNSLLNTSKNFKIFNIASSNQGILGSEHSARQFSHTSASKSNFNLSSDLNALTSNLNSFSKQSLGSGTNFYYANQKNNWADTPLVNKLSSNRLFLEAPYSAVISNDPWVSGKNYDTSSSVQRKTSVTGNKVTETLSSTTNSSNLVPIVLGSRDGGLPALTSAYWHMFWAHTNPDLRLKANIANSLNSTSFYLPKFVNYAEYDFLNDQALDLLEDAFWETAYSSYDHFDYLNTSDLFNKTTSMSLPLINELPHFTKVNASDEMSLADLSKARRKYYGLARTFFTSGMNIDDSLMNASLLNTRDLIRSSIIEKLWVSEDSYSALKHSVLFQTTQLNTPLLANNFFTRTPSYNTVLNNFRDSFDSFDVSSNTQGFSTPSMDTTSVTVDLADYRLDDAQASRFSNPVSLRFSAKNSIIAYNAYQKVFKLRFDDSRSNVKLESFTTLENPQPFVDGPRLSYESMLGKNKDHFYNSNFYNTRTLPIFNTVASLTTALNLPFYDFPFELGEVSDMTRYRWFDWYVRWGRIEVQPSSAAKYSNLGVPFSKKFFDYSNDQGEEFKRVETYFTRISRLRKNYLPVWTYTPYLLNKQQIWNNDKPFFHIWQKQTGEIQNIRYLLKTSKWQFTDLTLIDNSSTAFTPSVSGDSLGMRSAWRPYTSAHAYYYHVSHLADMLTKREYLYRQYFEMNNKVVNLPTHLTANPKNPLIEEMKGAFLFIDPINYTSEYSRDFYYSSLEFFKFLLFKEWLIQLNQSVSNLPINTSVLNNYLFFYFLNTPGSEKIGNNEELYKNQFRPIRKGISNMLRLHATGAVAMPTEIRLRILASSRDVIHSWAVPSAGIKIDCIPGYTSHRIMIFLNSGIYWGQCMEICGRYHHWMPIVVYFMKRDLFFLWCTHFAFRSAVSDVWDINDRQYADYIRFASYDKNTWLTELSRSM